MAIQTIQLFILILQVLTANCLSIKSDSTTGEASAFPPPSLDSPPLSIYQNKNIEYVKIVNRGQSISIDCPIRSASGGGGNINLSQNNIKWIFNDRVIENNDDINLFKQFQNGTLFIKQMKQRKFKDGASGEGKKGSIEGQYRCNFTNDVGTVITEPITVKYLMLARSFVEEPENETVAVEGDTVIFNCRIVSIPDAIIYWERDSQRITSKRFKELPNGSLLIENVQMDQDGGLYNCVAINNKMKKGNSVKSKSGKLIIIKQSSLISNDNNNYRSKPSIVSNFKKQMVVMVPSPTTSSYYLYCNANGYPKPRVWWQVPINSSVSEVINSTNLLSLTDISLDYNYTCVAQNDFGNDTQTWSIHTPPYFKVTPRSRHVPPAQTVRLNCSAGGNPFPKITWLKNGKPLRTPQNHNKFGRITLKPDTIQISDTVPQDSGLYQCIASNPHGEIQSTARILVQSKGNHPQPPTNISCYPQSPSSVCLGWAPVLGSHSYTVHYMKLDGGPEEIHNPTNMNYSLVDMLDEGVPYLFYLRAYAKEGASNQSEAIQCAGGEDDGERVVNLKVLKGGVMVEWNRLVNDVECGLTGEYKVQWRRMGHASNSVKTIIGYMEQPKYSYHIKGLTPSTTYEIRVISEMDVEYYSLWQQITIPNITTPTNKTTTTTENTIIDILITNLEAYPISSSIITLTWAPLDFYAPYNICYTTQDNCLTNATFIPTMTNSINITNLRPFTLYKFGVRVKVGNWSSMVECRTLEGVSSEVRGLRFSFTNSTIKVIEWLEPLYPNGVIRRFVVFYICVADADLRLNKWVSIVVASSVFQAVITDLNPNTLYNITIYAITGAGKGKPASIITPFNPTFTLGTATPQYTRHKRNQSVAIIIGCGIASICVALCITYLIWYTRRLKRQVRGQNRTINGGDGNGEDLTCRNGHSEQMRRKRDNGGGEIYEMEYLVGGGGGDVTTPLDTNMSNGFVVNHGGGGVRIIENPQKFNSDIIRNGGNNNNKMDSESEDEDAHQSAEDVNITQLTNLNNSILSETSSSIVIPPNG